MPADVATGSPWGFVTGFLGGLFGGRGQSYRDVLRERGPIQVPPVFQQPTPAPTPPIQELPEIVVTAPRPPISRTGSIGRYFDRVKKKFRKLSKEEREMLEFVGDYYANNYMPMPGGGLRRGNVKLPRNDARAGRSKQRGFVGPEPEVLPNVKPMLEPMRKPVRTPRVPSTIPRQPLPVFRPFDPETLPRETQPQRVPERKPDIRTAPTELPGTEFPRPQPQPQRVPQPSPQPKPSPAPKPAPAPATKVPAPSKTPTKLPSWALPFALQILVPRAQPKLGRSAQALRRSPLLQRVPQLVPPDLVRQLVPSRSTTGTQTKTDECECEKPEKKPRSPRKVCYEGTYTERAFGLNKRKRKEVPCQ